MLRPLSFLGKAVAIVAAAFAACAAAPAAAETWQPNEDDALILELHTTGYKLGDTLRGYQTPNGVCVDFADFIQAMDLPIRLDRKSRRATGWVFQERELFVLDRDSQSVQTMNGTSRLAGGAITDTPEGWCADLRALTSWTGVTFRADLGNLRIVLETDRKLPFLQQIERRSRAARLRPTASSFDLAQLPQQNVPYKPWRAPAVDVLIQTALRKGATAGRTQELQYEAYATGEALGVSYDARLASDTGGVPATLRLRGYRNDPAGEMLGPLKATQLAAGDVETYAGALTGQSAVGRGAFISNRPLSRPSRFAVTTLRGELPSGWDAELYRNGQLLAFQGDRSDGRYQFDNIELMFGENAFEVVLYGPQGQVRRDRSDMPVGMASIPAGKTWYWGGIVQQGRELIDFSRTMGNPLTGWRWGIGVEHGIDKRTMIGLESQSLVLRGRRRNYLEASVRRAVGPMLVELSGAQQLGAGRAMRLQGLAKIGRVNVQADTLWVDGGYESEQVTAAERRHFGLRLDSELKFGKSSIPVGLAARQSTSRDGSRIAEWSLRASLMARRMSLTAEVLQRQSSGRNANRDDDGMRVALLANAMVGKVRVRGDARFRLSGPTHGLENAQVVAEAHLSTRSDLRAGVEYTAANRRTDLTLGYVRQFERFALRAEGTVGTRGNIGAGLSLAFSIGPDPVDGGWRVTADKLAQAGQAVVTVFRDDNGDGYRQPGEAAIQGVEIESGFSHGAAQTNAEGRVLVDGLRPFTPAVIGVDGGSLPDPLLQPRGKGVVIVPRPGIIAEIALPLSPTGEIDGTLLGVDGQAREGVGLELADNRGQVIARTLTEFDGYFLFDQIPYGQYHLQVGVMSAQVLGASTLLGQPLTINRAHASLRVGTVQLQPARRAEQIATAP